MKCQMNVINMVVTFQNDKCHIKREILDQKLKLKKTVLKSNFPKIKSG